MPPKVLITAHGRGARDSWRALLELAPHLGSDWILIGGQMVAVYAAGQPDAMTRETTDADIVIDLRVSSKGFDMLGAWYVGVVLESELWNADVVKRGDPFEQFRRGRIAAQHPS